MTLHLVTGGTGYLGRHLVARLLADGRSVRVMARSGSDTAGLEGAELVEGDVTDAAAVERALDGVARVFHVAAETRDDQPADVYDRVNHQAVTTLLELAAGKVERLVHTSHYYAIGRSGEPRSAPEFVNDEYWTHDPGDMHDAHEQSKYDAENSLNQRVSLGEPVLAVIPTMMYGPEARPVSGPNDLAKGNRIVAMLARHAAGGYGAMPGDGRQIWNLAHVEDVAAAHVQVMDADDGSGTWPPPRWTHWHYLCGGENVRLAELFERFGKVAGVAPPAARGLPKKGLLGRLFGGGAKDASARDTIDSHYWAFSCDMASSEWGYVHRPLDEGLAQTVEWMRSSGLLD
jgi:dihydroflavonol-4-reductase